MVLADYQERFRGETWTVGTRRQKAHYEKSARTTRKPVPLAIAAPANSRSGVKLQTRTNRWNTSSPTASLVPNDRVGPLTRWKEVRIRPPQENMGRCCGRFEQFILCLRRRARRESLE